MSESRLEVCLGLILCVQEMLDANAHILSNGDRRARKKFFRAIENGDFEDDEFAVMMNPAGMSCIVRPQSSGC